MPAMTKCNNQTSFQQTGMIAECPTFTYKIISCLPGRKSPLSGVTYTITTSKTWRPCNVEPFYEKNPGKVYVCVKGCTNNKRAPKIFYVTPWECRFSSHGKNPQICAWATVKN